MATSEGYIKWANGNSSYVYQYKDHLGNVRVSYEGSTINGTTTPVIIEEDNYYPFGLRHSGYNTTDAASRNIAAHKYKYNGKELQDELGLNMYDYGARNYDPALGRWMNIDPLAEQGCRWSPYSYAMDNPVYFIDPDGMWPNPFAKIESMVRGKINNIKSTISKSYENAKQNIVNVGKAIASKLDKWEGAMGGYDLTSDLKSSSDKSDQEMKRKPVNGQHVQTVDATGLDAASGLSSGKSNNSTKNVKEVAEKLRDGAYKGDNINNAINQAEAEGYIGNKSETKSDTTFTITKQNGETNTIHFVNSAKKADSIQEKEGGKKEIYRIY